MTRQTLIPLSLSGAALCALLSGCSKIAVPGESEFSCAGRPDGVVCASATDMHEMTASADKVHEADLAPAETDTTPDRPREGRIDAAALRPAAAAPYPASPAALQPAAFGEPAPQAGQIRIWIAPWRDGNGDLRAPGYIWARLGAEGRGADNLLQTPEMIKARHEAAQSARPEAGAVAPRPPSERRSAPPSRARASPPRAIEVSS